MGRADGWMGRTDGRTDGGTDEQIGRMDGRTDEHRSLMELHTLVLEMIETKRFDMAAANKEAEAHMRTCMYGATASAVN